MINCEDSRVDVTHGNVAIIKKSKPFHKKVREYKMDNLFTCDKSEHWSCISRTC